MTGEPDEHEIPSDEIGQRARSAVGWRVLGRGSTMAVQMLTSLALARLLMPKDFGLVALAGMVTGLCGLFSDLGMGQALVQHSDPKPIHRASAFWGTLLMGALICGALVVLAPYVAAFFKDPRVARVLQLMSLSFLISPIGVVPRSLLQRQLDFKRPLFADMAGTLAYASIGLTMAGLGYGYWSLAGAQLASSLADSVGICVIARYVPPFLPTLRGVKDLYAFGLGVTSSNLLNYLAGQADYFVVGRVMDAAALGLYARAYTLVILPLQTAYAVVIPVMFPVFARLQDDRVRLRQIYARTVTVISLLTLPTLALLVVSAPELIPALIGDQWKAAVVPTQILVLGGAFRIASLPTSALFRGVGSAYVYRETWRQAVYAGLLVAGAWLGSRWGIVGVAWAVMVVLVIFTLLAVQLAHQCIGFGPAHYARALRGPAIGASGALLAAAGMRRAAQAFGFADDFTAAATLAVGVCSGVLIILCLPFGEVREACSELQTQCTHALKSVRRASGSAGGAE